MTFEQRQAQKEAKETMGYRHFQIEAGATWKSLTKAQTIQVNKSLNEGNTSVSLEEDQGPTKVQYTVDINNRTCKKVGEEEAEGSKIREVDERGHCTIDEYI